eukprot:6502956-Prymnesium_polylepis.1
MGDGEDRIVAKCVKWAVVRQVVVGTRERRAGVVVMVLSPQWSAVVVHLRAARQPIATNSWQLLPSGEVAS